MSRPWTLNATRTLERASTSERRPSLRTLEARFLSSYPMSTSSGSSSSSPSTFHGKLASPSSERPPLGLRTRSFTAVTARVSTKDKSNWGHARAIQLDDRNLSMLKAGNLEIGVNVHMVTSSKKKARASNSGDVMVKHLMSAKQSRSPAALTSWPAVIPSCGQQVAAETNTEQSEDGSSFAVCPSVTLKLKHCCHCQM